MELRSLKRTSLNLNYINKLLTTTHEIIILYKQTFNMNYAMKLVPDKIHK